AVAILLGDKCTLGLCWSRDANKTSATSHWRSSGKALSRSNTLANCSFIRFLLFAGSRVTCQTPHPLGAFPKRDVLSPKHSRFEHFAVGIIYRTIHMSSALRRSRFLFCVQCRPCWMLWSDAKGSYLRMFAYRCRPRWPWGATDKA